MTSLINPQSGFCSPHVYPGYPFQAEELDLTPANTRLWLSIKSRSEQNPSYQGLIVRKNGGNPFVAFSCDATLRPSLFWVIRKQGGSLASLLGKGGRAVHGTIASAAFPCSVLAQHLSYLRDVSEEGFNSAQGIQLKYERGTKTVHVTETGNNRALAQVTPSRGVTMNQDILRNAIFFVDPTDPGFTPTPDVEKRWGHLQDALQKYFEVNHSLALNLNRFAPHRAQERYESIANSFERFGFASLAGDCWLRSAWLYVQLSGTRDGSISDQYKSFAIKKAQTAQALFERAGDSVGLAETMRFLEYLR